MQRVRTAGRAGREGRKTRTKGGVVEERGELRIRLDGTFVLEIADLEVEALDLAVQLEREAMINKNAKPLFPLAWKRGE